MIRNFTPRLYQQTILGTAAAKNTLVVLPTGLGKTAIAFLLAAQRLYHYPSSKILMLSPTKPLCEQHVTSFQKHLEIPAEKVVLFTGDVNPEKRAELWKDAQIIISTPQGLENDIINKRIKLDEVSLLIFDESHHATGDYAYVWIAQQYEKTSKFSRILALTASPGSEMETVKEICQNLHIEKVEVRTEKDPDVKPYVQPLEFTWIKVDFPSEFKQIQKIMQDCFKSKLIEAQNLGFCQSANMRKGELLGLQKELHIKLASRERDFEMMRSVSLIAEALKIEHAIELLESQGIQQVYNYLHKIQQEALTSKIKATQNLSIDANFKAALFLSEELVSKRIQHPKIIKLKELIAIQFEQNPTAKIIIFTQFRDSAAEIVKTINELKIKNNIFVGQAKKKGVGFSQKQQKEILDRFRTGEFNILIATSVAEEGLDIPKVDKVLFYEPVPSAIRSIQRRGRTGRLEEGAVTILITNGTRDEVYRWSAHHKEKRMYRQLDELKKGLALQMQNREGDSNGSYNNGINTHNNYNNDPGNSTLQKFIPQEHMVAILADHREKDNKVIKELIDLGISVKTQQLEIADYLVSGKVAVELKKIPDFVASIIDGRLLDQVRSLKQHFDKAVLVVEGEEDIYSVRKVHPNAIRGMLASIVLDFGVPVLYTKNPRDTAGLLAVMARREQERDRDFSLHQGKPHSIQDKQEFIVSSFPDVGLQKAKKLLAHFGSLKKVINASKEELVAIEGIGEKTADKLLKLFEEEYGKK